MSGPKGYRVEEPGYNGAHWRVREKRGSARQFDCTDKCGSKAEHWSQIRNTTGYDPSHYEPRCRSCHNKYDYDTNNFTKLTPNDAAEIRQLYATGKWFQRELASIYGITQPTVSAIINNQTWSGCV